MKVEAQQQDSTVQSQALVKNTSNWSGKTVTWLKQPSNLIILMNIAVLFAALNQLFQDLFQGGNFDKEIGFDSVTHLTSGAGLFLIGLWALSAKKANALLAIILGLNLLRMCWIGYSLSSGNSTIKPEENAFDFVVPHCITATYAGHKLMEKEKIA